MAAGAATKSGKKPGRAKKKAPKKPSPRDLTGTRAQIVVEGITSTGALLAMQRVYRQPSTHDCTKEEQYWRYIFRENPGKYLEHMRKEEAAQKQATKEFKDREAEFERLKGVELEFASYKESAKAWMKAADADVVDVRKKADQETAALRADLTAAQGRVAELEEQLGSLEGDEYADPAVDRLRELDEKLAKRGRVGDG